MKFTEHYSQIMQQKALDESFSISINAIKKFFDDAKDYFVKLFNTDVELKKDILKYIKSDNREACEKLETEIQSLINKYSGIEKDYFKDAFSHVKIVKYAQLKHEEAGYGDVLNTVTFIRDIIAQLTPLVKKHVHENTDEFVKILNELQKSSI